MSEMCTRVTGRTTNPDSIPKIRLGGRNGTRNVPVRGQSLLVLPAYDVLCGGPAVWRVAKLSEPSTVVHSCSMCLAVQVDLVGGRATVTKQ